jgi:hypothetical protein
VLGVKRNALRTFPKNGWTIKYAIQWSLALSRIPIWRPQNRKHYQLIQNNCCIFACKASRIGNTMAYPTILSIFFPRELLSMLFDVLGSLKTKMAAAKPEVLVTRFPDAIA